MTTTTTTNVFESKWGFHPCSRELSKKLKKVRYYSHINSHQNAALARWERKLPHNRVRWVADGVSTDGNGHKVTHWKKVAWEKPAVCPVNLDILWKEYNKTFPKPSPEEVRKIHLTENQIDELINLAEDWLKSIGRENR